MQTKHWLMIFRRIKFVFIGALIIISIFCLSCVAPKYLTKSSDDNLRETVDFIQYWYYKSFDIQRWSDHVDGLKKAGYKSIILQYTMSFDENGFIPVDEKGSVFPAETVSALLTVADEKDFGVYLGLASSELWWKDKLYKSECEKLGDFQAKACEYAYAVAASHTSFSGFYMPFEAYVNNRNYEKYWAKTFNAAIAKIDELAPEYPLICSPYKGKTNRMSKKSVYSFCERFVNLINFRQIDIIAPQDGGGLADSDFNNKTEAAVDDFLSVFYTACAETGKCVFGVNIEFFTPVKGVYASQARIKKQRQIANRYADVILSFSYSHYYL